MAEEVKEIAFDELGLTKPLEKMTAKELRALCVAKLPMIVGASGKSKEELVANIKELFGIVEEAQTSPYKKQIFEIKRQMYNGNISMFLHFVSTRQFWHELSPVQP